MQLYFSILLSTLQMPEDVVLLSGVILIIEDVSVEFHSHPTLLHLRPPYPEQHPCSTSVHTGTSRKVAHLFWSPLLASVSVEPSSR